MKVKDVSAIIILFDTSGDRNSMKMKDVSAIIILFDILLGTARSLEFGSSNAA